MNTIDSTTERSQLARCRNVRVTHPTATYPLDMRAWAVLVGFCLAIAWSPNASGQLFSIGTNFTATTLSDSSFIPPDTMGSVGPQHVAVLINGQFTVHDKAGTPLMAKSLDQFWIDAGATPDNFSFDPRLLYDRHSQRWFAAAVDNQGQANHLLLAVSSSSDPTTSWHGFQIDADTDDQQWADFPMLGMNGDVIAVFATMFPTGCCTASRNLLVVPKDDLTAAVPTVANATLLENVNAPFNSQPVVDLDNRPLPLPLLSGYFKPLNGLLIRNDIAGSPQAPSVVSPNVFTLTTVRNEPRDVDQPGPSSDIDAGSARFGASVIALDGSLWGTHGVDFNGRAAVEWYEIEEATGALLQNGIIADPSLGFNFPSIAVNDDRDVVLGFSGGDPNTFMSAYAVVGSTSGGMTTFSPPTQLVAGNASYERLDSSGRNRWGDYSATVLDPTNDQHFWTFQEFALNADEWAIQVTQFIIPEPSSGTMLALLAVGLVCWLSTRGSLEQAAASIRNASLLRTGLDDHVESPSSVELTQRASYCQRRRWQ